MLKYSLIFFALGILPFSLHAETILYACTINGQTILESTPDENCDTLETYHYMTYNNPQSKQKSELQSANALRPEETRELQAIDSQKVSHGALVKRFENVDDRVGWADANAYIDSRQDKCALYLDTLYNILAIIDVSPQDAVKDMGNRPSYQPGIVRPEIRGDRIMADLRYAQSQVNYYCSH